MTEIDPLEHFPVVHDGLDDCGEFLKFSNFVVAEHDGAADEFDIDCLLLFLLQFFLGFGGDVFHGRGVD